MPPGTATSPLDSKLLAALRSRLGPVPIALVLRDTEDLPDTDSPLVGTVRIPDRSTLLSLVVSPELGFGDGYSDGRIEVEGDLVRSLECVYQSPAYPELATGVCARSSWTGPKPTPTVDRSAIFIATTTSPTISTACGSISEWCTPAPTFQTRTLRSKRRRRQNSTWCAANFACSRVRLSLEVGCGWGALAIYMAQNYGVHVKAYNISHEQIVWARECAQRGRSHLTGGVH